MPPPKAPDSPQSGKEDSDSDSDSDDALSLGLAEDPTMLSFADPRNMALKSLCADNGISEEKFKRGAGAFEELESCFGRMVTMPRCLRHFSGLLELNISCQRVARISNLDNCVNLQALWLHENHIKRISGLSNCRQLKQLFLWQNHIEKIEGLERLEKLEVLWLNENRIRKVEGLKGLGSLKTLWLATNRIARIDADVFAATPMLEELNVSANEIGCFREIPSIARLPNLRHLLFADALHGSNPVAMLCNYQTYVLFHVSQLHKLDNMMLGDEAKHMAEATYMKKKMYYNMRIKTMKRNTTNVIKVAVRAKKNCVSQINLSLNVLVKTRKDIQREIDERQHLPAITGGEQDEEAAQRSEKLLEGKRATLDDGVKHADKAAQRMALMLEEFKSRCFRLLNFSISNLILELETGGNIRLEEGKPSDVWYSSCVDLVQSRFFSHDFRSVGISSIKIRCVSRVHNRFLRNRFDQTLESTVNTNDSSYKKSLEYLFYGVNPDTHPSAELQRVVEDGFPEAEEWEGHGKDAAVPLTNSVSMCDLPRVRSIMRKHKIDAADLGSDVGGAVEVRSGKLLIAKVFLGKYTQEREGTAGSLLKASEYSSAGTHTAAAAAAAAASFFAVLLLCFCCAFAALLLTRPFDLQPACTTRCTACARATRSSGSGSFLTTRRRCRSTSWITSTR